MNGTDTNVDRRLIYDVGMHLGEDTEYYLKRGFNVIAFEANPDLVKANTTRFASEIQSGLLTIVEGAIVEDQSQKTVTFYVNEDSSVWGTVNPAFAERNEHLGTRNRIVEVKAINFNQSLHQYGVPYFIKIDIEGSDRICLKALNDFEEKPLYLSIESDKRDFDVLLSEIRLLEKLGYDSFKAVQQGNVPKMKIPAGSREGKIVSHTFSREASGMFGSDLPGHWLSEEELISEYKNIFKQYRRIGDDTFWQKNPFARKLLKGLSRITGKHYPGWYDTHARHKSASIHR